VRRESAERSRLQQGSNITAVQRRLQEARQLPRNRREPPSTTREVRLSLLAKSLRALNELAASYCQYAPYRTPDDIEVLRATSVSRTKNGTEILGVISFFRTEHGAIGPVIDGKEMDWLALKAYAARKVWRFAPATQEKIAYRIRTLDIRPLAGPEEEEDSRSAPGTPLARPMCSIHIRKGDKVGGEAAEVQMSKYLDALKETNLECRSYFLASDAISSSKKQLRQYLWRHHGPRNERPLIATLDYSEGGPYDADGYRWGSFLSSDEAGRVQNTIDLLAEYEVSSIHTRKTKQIPPR
jgi:hypothetical protein